MSPINCNKQQIGINKFQRGIKMQWEMVIGLEIHTQLATKSKIFSGASTEFGQDPNTQACLVDLAMPGILPVLNTKTVELAVRFGTAIGAKIGKRSIFDRKNYFYPDSPKGYQTSQLYFPIVGEGSVDVEFTDGSTKTIGITRAHLEEDAGKSVHDLFPNMTGIDLNRAGTPLLEIVSEPDMRSAKEAIAYAKKIRQIVRYLGVSDGNMQEGSFRCDVNISMRPEGQKEFGTRAEIKNINSFRFIEKAIQCEMDRQIDLLESGQKVVQETRLYDANKDETRSMRSKEEANDYRYFPCPDLLPIEIDDHYIQAIKDSLPELPEAKRARFIKDYQLSEKDATRLSADRLLADYFETVVEKSTDAKLASNWVSSDLLGALNKAELNIEQSPINAEQLGALILRIKDNTISGKIAKNIFEAIWNGEGQEVDAIIEAKGLKQITDSGAIETIIDEIIANNAGQAEQYRGGKTKLMGFFVGQVMKASQGKANPAQVNQLLKKKLG